MVDLGGRKEKVRCCGEEAAKAAGHEDVLSEQQTEAATENSQNCLQLTENDGIQKLRRNSGEQPWHSPSRKTQPHISSTSRCRLISGLRRLVLLLPLMARY